MRLIRLALALSTAVFGTSVVSTTASADGSPNAEGPSNPDDLLGNIVVVAGASRPLPKIAVLPSLSAEMEDVTLRSVVRRDLDLSGEFELLPDQAAPEGLYLPDSPVDVRAWAQKGVEAIVRVSGKKTGPEQAELRGQAYLLSRGATAVFDRSFVVPLSAVRLEAHRVADHLIGALTGQNGGFASHMTFASGSGTLRRVFTIDADGHDARAVSPPDQTAIAPAFGKDEALYYAASIKGDEYAIFSPAVGRIPLSVKGSVYGIAFSRDRSAVAVSIGVGPTLKIFSGPDFTSLKLVSDVGMAMHPVFTPSGKLAFSGEGKYGQRIYVDGKPISPDGIFASAPVFCNHPDGVRAIFAVGVGKNTDLVATGERGGPLVRLTQNQRRNGYPACSPDGRLIAFFSTRDSGEGPGLYIMRTDGQRPKRVSTLVGDSLRWDPIPQRFPVQAGDSGKH